MESRETVDGGGLVVYRLLRIVDNRRVKAQIQFEPRDLWVGVFWRHTQHCLHLYVCIIPLLPLHVTILIRDFDGGGMSNAQIKR